MEAIQEAALCLPLFQHETVLHYQQLQPESFHSGCEKEQWQRINPVRFATTVTSMQQRPGSNDIRSCIVFSQKKVLPGEWHMP